MTYATPEHAAVEKNATVETVMKHTGQQYAKHFHKFEIKITSSFKRNEAWSQTNILYEVFIFVRINGIRLYILYMEICNIYKPEFRGERCRTCPPLHSHPHKKVMIISGRRNKCGNFIESTWIFSFVA